MPNPRKPIALRILQGNPGKRPIPDEVEIKGEFPSAPSVLDAKAKKEWRRLAPILTEIGVLTPADWGVFALYCAAFSRFQSSAAHCKKYGEVVVKLSGQQAMSPHYYVMRQSGEDMRKLAGELGITPAARSKVIPTKKAKKNEFDDL